MCLTCARDPECTVLEMCFPEEPCVWSLSWKALLEGQETGARTRASHQCRDRRQRERLDLSSRPVSALGVQDPEVQGKMTCPCGDLGTIGALCACLLGETPGCEPQPGTAAAGTMVTVPLNLHSADLTSLPACRYPVFRTYPTARVRAGRDENWSQNHGHSLSQ